MSASKIIIINRSASRKKYGSKWSKIDAAIKKLVVADGKRNVTAQVIAIDSAAQMKKLDGKAVTKTDSASQVKRAIDAAFQTIMPHYIMLLGGPDLIPYVHLRNPLEDVDEDPDVPSDLPYACDAGYSLSIEKFVGATRVLGRLPDIPGSRDPAYLIHLLDVASNWTSGTTRQYKNYFSVTASVWKGSTRKNVKKLFGTTKKLQICPAATSPWTKTVLKPRMHFINCHGAPADAGFYGEPGADPLAQWSENLKGAVTTGTVVAAESCYGAMVYEPDASIELPMSIPSRYLLESAYGYLGSTNIAWGSSTSILLADEICQHFVGNVQKGASLGRALLQARHKFVSDNAPLGPHSLKTLAQFTLLGDPSIHPIKASSKQVTKPVKVTSSFIDDVADHVLKEVDFQGLFQKTLSSTITAKKEVATKSLDQRTDRRLSLFRKGIQLNDQIAAVNTLPEKSVNKEMLQLFKNKVGKETFRNLGKVTSYVVDEATNFIQAKSMSARKKAKGGIRFMIGVAEQDVEDSVGELESIGPGNPKLTKLKMVVAKEEDGKIEEVQEYLSR